MRKSYLRSRRLRAVRHEGVLIGAWVRAQVVRMFTADAKMVKKRLEDLIDREYLTRDENNPNMYRYVA